MEAAQTAAPAPEGRPTLGRRTYVIDRGFQLKYTAMLVVLGAVISSLFAAMMYLAHLDAERALPAAPHLQEQLAHNDTTLVMLMVGITVLMAGALGLVGVLITHRVAGPVYVMSHYIGVLSRGRYPLMRPLRRQDELKEFFERFQEAVESMRSREAKEAEELKRAIEVLAPLATSDAARATLGQLHAMQERKRDATDRIDVGR